MSNHRMWIWFVGIIGALATGSAAQVQEFTGLIESHRIINIGSPQIGVLATVDVDRGDLVKAGQVIATLQDDVERAAMEVARYRAQMESGIKASQANLELAERKKTRFEQLYSQNVAPFVDMDEAVTAKKLAEMQLKEAEENRKLAELDYKRAAAQVERMSIRSPVNGVVVERFQHPGEHVENEPILKIAQVDPLNVELILPKTLFLQIKVGMKARVIPENPIGGEYNAAVKIVDQVIDGASGTFGVRLELPNPDNKLPAGIKCQVIFPGR